MSLHACTAPGCSRQFLDRGRLQDHADAVHTFDDITQQVAEALREAFGSGGATALGDPRIYCWIQDISDVWVVFQLEISGGDTSLQQASYTILDGVVSFGDPVEVVRQTVYVPAG